MGHLQEQSLMLRRVAGLTDKHSQGGFSKFFSHSLKEMGRLQLLETTLAHISTRE